MNIVKKIRIFAAYAWAALFSLLFFPFCFFFRFYGGATGFFGSGCALPSLPLLGIKVVFENKEELKKIRSSILISNHQHNIDFFILALATPPNTICLIKKEVIFLPIIGPIIWSLGNILISRSSRKQAQASLAKAKDAMAKQGKNIWIMPEGTRSHGRGLLPFKRGAFRLAIAAQVPIYPIVVSEYYPNLARRSGNVGTVKIAVLPPISTEGLNKEDVGRLQGLAYEQIRNKIKAMGPSSG